MTGRNFNRIAVLTLCMGFSLWFSHSLRRGIHGTMNLSDFGGIYYGSRCALLRMDPYDPGTVLREFNREGGVFPTNANLIKSVPIVITIGVNLPTALFLLVPFALLPWGVAESVWIALTAGLLIAAAFLVWDLASETTPAIAGCLAGFALANCVQLLMLGNIAGAAVSLCVIGSWCFLRERYVPAGVVMLAISLVLKPHDAGFVWLYFLLAGGVMRRRAIQTLAVTAVLGLFAALWISPASPHWLEELHRNHVTVAARGGTSDPGPTGMTSEPVVAILDLQAPLSIFRDDPRFYNSWAYLTGGTLILVWAITVLRRSATHEQNLLSLAAISVLTLLPVYHRPYDAKLLMLTFPACALLWSSGGRRRWLSLAFTCAAVMWTSDLPVVILGFCLSSIHASAATLGGKLITVFLLKPAPVVLLATGCFYLWTYIRYTPTDLPFLNSNTHRISP